MANLTDEQLSEEFCKEAGIEPKACALIEGPDNEVRFYSTLSGARRKPKGWENSKLVKFDKPRYPDLINDTINFSMLINVHWYLFGTLGDVYKRTGEETFERNYVRTRLNALKLSRTYGGGSMLNEYINNLQDIDFNYLHEDEW